MERVKAQSELFGLPETIVPHSVLAFGYPDEAVAENEPQRPPHPDRPADFPTEKGAYEAGRVHWEAW